MQNPKIFQKLLATMGIKNIPHCKKKKQNKKPYLCSHCFLFLSRSLFSLPLIPGHSFSPCIWLVAASISHFVTAVFLFFPTVLEKSNWKGERSYRWSCPSRSRQSLGLPRYWDRLGSKGERNDQRSDHSLCPLQAKRITAEVLLEKKKWIQQISNEI